MALWTLTRFFFFIGGADGVSVKDKEQQNVSSCRRCRLFGSVDFFSGLFAISVFSVFCKVKKIGW